MSGNPESKSNATIIIAIITGIFALCGTILTVIAAPIIMKMLEETPTAIVIIATTIPPPFLSTNTSFVQQPADTPQISTNTPLPPPPDTPLPPPSDTPLPPPSDTPIPTITPDIVVRNLIANVGGNYFPDLALSWNVSDDARIWTFNLRNDVKMADGQFFNASTVREVLSDWQPVRVGVATVEIVDNYTVTMNFPQSPTDFKKFFNDLSIIEFKTLR